MIVEKDTLIQVIVGNGSKLFSSKLNIDSVLFAHDAGDVAEVAEDVVDTLKWDMLLDRKGEDRAMGEIIFFHFGRGTQERR